MRDRHRGSGSTRRRVGLLVDWLEDDYQNAVVGGVADEAREQDVDLICFAGGVLQAPDALTHQRNAAHDLAGPENVDGLMVMSGALGNHIGHDALARYCERHSTLPMCSIAVPLRGIPSVLVDNAAGMRQLMVHLVEEHGYRRIAFIRGPEANEEAEGRYRVAREVLAEHSLALEPGVVVVGDFQRESGARAVDVLLGGEAARVEAIVAASDAMALGAIDALRARGITVPDEVAVVGFDDIEESRFSSPPLTTVRQPLYEQGRRAVELLCARLRGEGVPDHVTLSTELVARQSCGCRRAWGFLVGGDPQGPALGRRAGAAVPASTRILLEDRARVASDLTHAARAPELDGGWAERLFEAFVEDLRAVSLGETPKPPLGAVSLGETPKPPLGAVSLGETPKPPLELESKAVRFLAGILETRGGVGAWQDVVSALRAAVRPWLVEDARALARAEHVWHEMRLLAANAAERTQARHRFEVERWARNLSRTSGALITTFDLDALVRAVAEQLPLMRIRSCYLSLYARAASDDAPPRATSRLILAYDADSMTGAHHREQLFASRLLAPPGALPNRRTSFVVEPLFFREEQLGFALFELGPREGSVYEALREQVSAALAGAVLVREVVAKDVERGQLLADLEKRAHELEAANRAIQENQERLLSSEKLASLGRLTASIVHEMNTPLAAVRAALVDLGKLVTEYGDSAGDQEVTVADHAEIVEEMRQAIGLAGSAAERAVLFVRGIKAQTRDLGPHERQAFNVVATVRQALLLLGHKMRTSNCRSTFDPPAEYIELLGSPVRFSQVVTNLVENAVDASTSKGGGVITVQVALAEGALLLSVKDEGSGIANEIIPRIYEPMFTTKPFGHGTGLGLSIVRDIVTGDFGGDIALDTGPGQGTRFTVRFPIGSFARGS